MNRRAYCRSARSGAQIREGRWGCLAQDAWRSLAATPGFSRAARRGAAPARVFRSGAESQGRAAEAGVGRARGRRRGRGARAAPWRILGCGAPAAGALLASLRVPVLGRCGAPGSGVSRFQRWNPWRKPQEGGPVTLLTPHSHPRSSKQDTPSLPPTRALKAQGLAWSPGVFRVQSLVFTEGNCGPERRRGLPGSQATQDGGSTRTQRWALLGTAPGASWEEARPVCSWPLSVWSPFPSPKLEKLTTPPQARAGAPAPAPER
ncbi:uncharacterized protein LOC130853546 [Hippopotamus amphibius kiboko]|uniref:uncharacterized protein LOC130853546 n=1 Tax=Hippopotamus amphibius kiboko TaxID=575201 RepID=UPI002592971A|nr:uncharacterized protein LOC130853546 [Hippopotamus amphibius kiboko]